MSSSDTQSIDQYLARVEQVTQQQHVKVAQLITDTQKNIDGFKPLSIENHENTEHKITTLYDTINQQLEKAMQALQQQVEDICATDDTTTEKNLTSESECKVKEW